MVVADISLTRDSSLHWLQRLRQRCPEMKLIVLSFHDEPSVRRAAIEAGADGFVLTRAIATDLLPAVESVLAGRRDVAPASGAIPRGRPHQGGCQVIAHRSHIPRVLRMAMIPRCSIASEVIRRKE